MFKYEYETRYGDYKDYETIKPAVVLDIMQDVAIKHSASRGYGIHKLREMNFAWLLQGVKVDFVKPISTEKNIVISTGVKNMRGVVSERCSILEQDGEVVAKTVAAWFIFDTARMTVSKIPPEIASAYEMELFEDEFFRYTKPELREADPLYTITVSNKEIDTNRHLNNQKSAELLMDALPFDFSFAHMNVLYKKAAHLGDKLEVCSRETDNGYYVHLQTPEKEICVAGVFER